jgi:hypothetical protein
MSGRRKKEEGRGEKERGEKKVNCRLGRVK